MTYSYSAVLAAAALVDDLPYPRSLSPSSSVYVVSTAAIEKDDQVTLQTLAGVLARSAPAIYTVASDPAAPAADDTTVFWLRQLEARTSITFHYDYLHDFRSLLTRFAPNVTGYVRYSPQTKSSNAALIRCAAEPGNAIAVASDTTAALLESLGVPMVANVSSSTPYDEFMRGKDAMSRRVAVFQPDDGSKAQSLSDYSVFARAPVVEAPANGESPAFNAVLAHLDETRLNAAFGWGGDEHQWVVKCTQHGAVAHASDFANNLALLANVPPAPRPPLPRPSPPPLARPRSKGPVHTVAFITSDGDNIQLLEHRDFIDDDHYGSPLRGSIPVGWSYSPAMALLMPTLLDWVRSSLTANDSLSAGPSGLGYAYPALLPPAQAQAFARLTGQLMAQSGESLLNVLGVTPSAESLEALTQQPQVAAISYLTFGAERFGYAGLHGNVAYLGDKPVVGVRLSLWGDEPSGAKVGVDGLVQELSLLPKDPNDPNSYSLVVSELGNGYAMLIEAAKRLELLGGFELVLPEVLIERLVQSTQRKQQCPMPSGPWSAACGDLPRCSIAGNGSCVFTCESIEFRGVPIKYRASCDLSVCSQGLALEQFSMGRARFLCADGSECPGGA